MLLLIDALMSTTHKANCAYRKPLASVNLVNISQMDSRHGVLLGHRDGEKFYFVCPFDRTFGMGCQTDKTLFRRGCVGR